MTRVLLTGATGFIGSAVLRRLLRDGHEVVALHGKRGPGEGNARLTWRRADLLQSGEGSLAANFSGLGTTHCIHAAWYTNHADYLVHGVNRDWVGAGIRLADAFRKAGGRRFVGLGTCLEYDVARADGPCSEDRTPLRPQTLYAKSKLELFSALAKRSAEFAWARVFFVYGPGDRPGRLVPNLLDKFSVGEAAGPTYGGLRRDYIHVDDLAGQIVRIALGEAAGPVNCGTGEAPSLSEIFQTAAELMGCPQLARTNSDMGDQPPLIQADLARFREQVGEPEARGIREGLKAMIVDQER